jgi:DNA-binding GntR family transcriptional regulator
MMNLLPQLPEQDTSFGFVGVKQGLFEFLRLQIIVGNLKPGMKLNETELASRFNISRAPLREAFRLLENENLVTSFPRRGCYVAELSLNNCIEVCQIREMIECFAIDLLEKKGNPDVSAAARSLEHAAKLPLPSTDAARERFDYLKAVLDFHIKLVEAAGNSRLCQLYEGIYTTLARYRSTYRPTTGLASRTRKEHEHILDLITERRYSEAKDLTRSHLNLAFEQITKAMLKKTTNKSKGGRPSRTIESLHALMAPRARTARGEPL